MNDIRTIALIAWVLLILTVATAVGQFLDLLAAISGNIATNWTADAGWQYNADSQQTQKFNISSRYQPQYGKVLNLAYRETVNSIRQTDISMQWPVQAGWTSVGRWNYSLLDNRALEALAGIEYNDRCWSLRIAAHRFATTSSAASSTPSTDAVPALANSTPSVVISTLRVSGLPKKVRYAAKLSP